MFYCRESLISSRSSNYHLLPKLPSTANHYMLQESVKKMQRPSFVAFAHTHTHTHSYTHTHTFTHSHIHTHIQYSFSLPTNISLFLSFGHIFHFLRPSEIIGILSSFQRGCLIKNYLLIRANSCFSFSLPIIRFHFDLKTSTLP